jgi:hypothetical protein
MAPGEALLSVGASDASVTFRVGVLRREVRRREDEGTSALQAAALLGAAPL